MNTGGLTGSQYEKLLHSFEQIPYVRLLGLEIDELDIGKATLGLTVKEDLMRSNGVVHGGAIASLVDTATAFASLSLLTENQTTTTVDLTIHFLRPLREGRATARAEVVRDGRRLLVISAEVFDDAGSHLATAVTTYMKIVLT